MPIPLEINFVNMDPSPAVEDAVREKAEKLESFAEHVMRCRVTVEAPHKHHRKGKIYHVVVDVHVPGREIVASRSPHKHHAHEDVYVAVRDAFNAARRQLQDYVRVTRGKVKGHEAPPHGRVVSIDSEGGFGRIESSDGREIYFHRNAVVDADFATIEAGAEVRFDEEEGDKGPQATTVHLVGKHHVID